MRTRGACPACGQGRLLPGRIASQPGIPVCGDCAGIPTTFRCKDCSKEGEFYRRGQCARCALADKGWAEKLLIRKAVDAPAMQRLREAFLRAEKPEHPCLPRRSERALSARTTERGRCGAQSPSAGRGAPQPHNRTRARSPRKRGATPHRDHHLALFDRWLDAKFAGSMTRAFRGAPDHQRFGRWHHLGGYVRGRKKVRDRGTRHTQRKSKSPRL